MAQSAPKILVVDDELSMRELLEYMLSNEGYAVTCAETGREAIAALEAGKHVACEKPLAATLEDAEAMAAAAASAAGKTFVWFNYRRVPAISLAKQLVDEGRIGTPFQLAAS